MHLRAARFVSPFSTHLFLSSCNPRSLLSLSLSLSILITDHSSFLSSAYSCSFSIISLRLMRLYELLEYTIHMRRALILYVCDLSARFICTGTHDRTHAASDALENTYKSARTMPPIWAPPMNGETSSDAAGSTWTLFKNSVRPFIRIINEFF